MRLNTQRTVASIAVASVGGSASIPIPEAIPNIHSCALAAESARKGMQSAKLLSALELKFNNSIQCSFRLSARFAVPKVLKITIGHRSIFLAMRRKNGLGLSYVRLVINVGMIWLLQIQMARPRHNPALDRTCAKSRAGQLA